jgi:dTDP-4-amino-4,6-dideoxygalactose transaminase
MPAPADYFSMIQEIHENGWFSNFGPFSHRLESLLLAEFGATDETCVTASSGTAGLSAALLATGRPGPILLPAFTFPASLGAVRAAGMTPIIVDVDADEWTLSRSLMERAIAETRAQAVMLVQPFGIRRPLDAALALCRKHDVALVIDNASGLGGPRPSDGHGEQVFEVYSMHATKPIAVGEGGVIFAHRAHDAALRAALNFALTSNQGADGPKWGFNGKMSEFHAAVGIAQMQRYRDIVRARQAVAAAYIERLAKYEQLFFPRDVTRAPWQFFPVLFPTVSAAERFIELTKAVGLEIRRYYRPSLSRWPETNCFGPCLVSEDLSDRICVFPVRGLAASYEVEEIAKLVLDALDRTLANCRSR